MQSNDDLNDLRFVAAIAETGSLSGAARRLGVSHATAFRRIEAFEARLGVKLFERSVGRYAPTVAGEELARAGAEIEREAIESLRKVAGHDLRPSGLVRVTTTDTFANALIAPMARACLDAHPGILLQVSISNEFYSLSKRDADIAIRTTRTPPEHLVGKRIGVVAMAAYGSKQYLRCHPDKELPTHRWIAVDDSLEHNASLAWLARFMPPSQAVYRTNTFTSVAQACAAGAGLAVLPCFIGDRSPLLKRVTAVIEECTNDLWILSHPDLRNTMRIKTIFQTLQEQLGAAAPLLAGEMPKSAGK